MRGARGGRAAPADGRGGLVKKKVICPREKAIGDSQGQAVSRLNKTIGDEDFSAAMPLISTYRRHG